MQHANQTLQGTESSAIPFTGGSSNITRKSLSWNPEEDTESDVVYTHFGSVMDSKVTVCATYNPVGPTVMQASNNASS